MKSLCWSKEDIVSESLKQMLNSNSDLKGLILIMFILNAAIKKP